MPSVCLNPLTRGTCMINTEILCSREAGNNSETWCEQTGRSFSSQSYKNSTSSSKTNFLLLVIWNWLRNSFIPVSRKKNINTHMKTWDVLEPKLLPFHVLGKEQLDDAFKRLNYIKNSGFSWGTSLDKNVQNKVSRSELTLMQWKYVNYLTENSNWFLKNLCSTRSKEKGYERSENSHEVKKIF